jgi:hypothetical protein
MAYPAYTIQQDLYQNATHHTQLTTNEALSGVMGSISLAAWIFLLLPQLIENHTNGHADGISMTFLFIWAAGDILSLAGGLWAGLVPTVIALAIYFCFADGALIAQCVYYNTLNREKDAKAAQEGEAETTPAAVESDPLLASASAQRKPSTTSRRSRRSSARRDSLSRALAKPSAYSATIQNCLSILAICAAGTAGWALAYKTARVCSATAPRCCTWAPACRRSSRTSASARAMG